MTGFTERQTFSTDTIDPRISWKAWRENVGAFFFKVDIEHARRDAAAGALVRRGFANVSVSGVSASAQRVVRSRRLALDDGIESYCFVFPTSGSFKYRHRGHETKVGAGGAAVIDATEAFEVEIEDGSQCTCLSVPGDLARARVRGIDNLCGRSDFADPVLASTLRHLAANALDVAPSVDADGLQDLCLNMIDMMILRTNHQGDESQPYNEVVTRCLLDKVRRVIRARLSDPRFGVDDAAAACGASTRRLQQALKSAGSTFGRELMDARLLASAQLLKSRDSVPRQIGEVAAECGFSSQAHFATRYRERFGRSPRAERERA